jgi:hypothetical protein
MTTPPDSRGIRRRCELGHHIGVTTVDVPQAPLGGWSLVATKGVRPGAVRTPAVGVDVPQAPLGGWSLEATKGAARGCPDADRGFNHRLPQAIPEQICDA